MIAEIPTWKKLNMTINEAAEYSGIGIHKLYELTDDPDCSFVLRVGLRRLVNNQEGKNIVIIINIVQKYLVLLMEHVINT